MNVLLVHNFYQYPGGEDRVFADEGTLLEQQGHIVARFTVHNDAVSGMGKLEMVRKTIWNRDAQVPLRQAIRDVRAQVVHFHNTLPLISPAAYYTAHEEGAAVVQTLHNYRLMCPAATLFRDGHVCEECVGRRVAWPAVVHGCYRESRPASAAVAAMLWTHRRKGTWQNEVDAYVALTEFGRRKFIEGGLPAERIVVKPNFVDPDPGVGAGEGDFALFVGRLAPEKGICTLLKAWISLQCRCRSVLKIAGDGPLRQTVIDAAGQTRCIEYLGQQGPAEVFAMMGSARALVVASQWYEGQPRTIIESLAKGTPVIAPRLGAMPEMIEHERTGLLFDAGSADDLARQAERMLQETDRARMRQAARADYESLYTARRNYPMIVACYEKALGRMAPKQT